MITEQQKAEDRYWGELYGAEQLGIRQGLQQGIQQGIKEGLQQGTFDAKLDAARAALQLHLSHDQVMAITGLDAATVDRLADELGLTVA